MNLHRKVKTGLSLSDKVLFIISTVSLIAVLMVVVMIYYKNNRPLNKKIDYHLIIDNDSVFIVDPRNNAPLLQRKMNWDKPGDIEEFLIQDNL